MKKDNKEILLSEDQIQEILIEASDPILRHPNISPMSKNGVAGIYKVGSQNGVIMIRGNAHTGFSHIIEGHNYDVTDGVWKENESKKVYLKRSSQFRRGAIPIKEYTFIADQLFIQKNINIEKNKRRDNFDLYIGEVETNKVKAEYFLLTYKNTPIVHTLYPSKKKFNSKKLIDLKRGNPIITQNQNVLYINVPYLNVSFIQFLVIIERDFVEKSEQIIIKEFDKNEKEINHIKLEDIPYEELPYSENSHILFRATVKYKYHELEPIEKKIREILNNRKTASI